MPYDAIYIQFESIQKNVLFCLQVHTSIIAKKGKRKRMEMLNKSSEQHSPLLQKDGSWVKNMRILTHICSVCFFKNMKHITKCWELIVCHSLC